MECYVDADFAGLWLTEDIHNKTCVPSRTGYLITLGGAPIVWSSKLQSEIALNACKSEFVALSTAMKALVPL